MTKEKMLACDECQSKWARESMNVTVYPSETSPVEGDTFEHYECPSCREAREAGKFSDATEVP
jgi:hypothetical protein